MRGRPGFIRALLPVQAVPDAVQRRRNVKPPGKWSTLCHSPFSLSLGKRLVGRRIEWRAARIVRPSFAALCNEGAYLAAAHEGGIDKAFGNQSIQCLPIVGK